MIFVLVVLVGVGFLDRLFLGFFDSGWGGLVFLVIGEWIGGVCGSSMIDVWV